MHRLTIAAVASAALALGACGSKSSDSSTPAPATSTPAASAAPSSSTGTVKVTMQDIKFAPHDITVKVGQKIQWTNNDQVGHNVTATKGATFASDTVNNGQTFTYTPTKAGVIDYVCTIHSGQDGTITVTK
jgi:plastocyanin